LKQSFLRPVAGEALFTAEKDPKRLAPGARRRGSCRTDPLRILAAAGRRRTRTSMCFKHRRLFPAVAYDARRALRRVVALGRASMRYMPASPFHPTAACRKRVARDLVARVIAAQRRNPGRIAPAKPGAHRAAGTGYKAWFGAAGPTLEPRAEGRSWRGAQGGRTIEKPFAGWWAVMGEADQAKHRFAPPNAEAQRAKAGPDRREGEPSKNHSQGGGP